MACAVDSRAACRSTDEKQVGMEAASIRVELKAWEAAFRAEHGRKAAREDIKKDAAIQCKYKLYHELTSRAAPTKAAGTTPSKSAAKAPAATPSRTPSTKHAGFQPAPASSAHDPEPQPTPAFIRNALGPTPHRDGQVLSIFDIAIENTPPHAADSPSSTNAVSPVAGTPSKSAPESAAGRARTPQSLSKRFFLDAFAGTPLKRKRDETDIGFTSSPRRKFATPSFLRRSAPIPAPIALDDAGAGGRRALPAPFRTRGLVRSLSSIVQRLRQQEEQRMDEEWDVLHDIEEEEAERAGATPKGEASSMPGGEDRPEVEMPLGPDQAPASSEEHSDAENRAETGRKPWKKKGLKRQTRRTNMRPVLHKPNKALEHDVVSEHGLDDDDEEEEEEEEVERVAETATQCQRDLDGKADERGEDSEDASECEKRSAATKKKKKEKQKKTKNAVGKQDEQGEEARQKKNGRKVDPLAHANFRALKIKNKNSKAGGRGKRFGRR